MQKEIDMLMNRLPNNAEAKKLRGYTSAKICFEKYGDAQTAKNYLQMYLEERPNNIPAIVLLGDILFSEKKYEEALVNFERAYTLNPLQKDLLLKICDVLLKIPHKDTSAISAWIKVLKMEYPSNENIALLEKIMQNMSAPKEESLTDNFYDTISTFNLSPMEKSQNKEYQGQKIETNVISSLTKAKPHSNKLNFPTSPPKLYSTLLNSPNYNDGKNKSHLPPIIFNSPFSIGIDDKQTTPTISTSCNSGNIIINLGTSFSNIPVLHSKEQLNTNNQKLSQKNEDFLDSLPPKEDNVKLQQLEAKVLSHSNAMNQVQDYITKLCDTFEQCMPSTKKYMTIVHEQNNSVIKCMQELSKQQSDFGLILNHVFDGLKLVSQNQQLLKEQLLIFNHSLNSYNYAGMNGDYNRFGHRPASQPQPHHQTYLNDAQNSAPNQYYYPHPDNPYYNHQAAQYWQGNIQAHQAPIQQSTKNEMKVAANISSKGGQASQASASVKSTSSSMTVSMGQFQFAPFTTVNTTNTTTMVSSSKAIVKSEPSPMNNEPKSQAADPKSIFSFKPQQTSTAPSGTMLNAVPGKSMAPLPTSLKTAVVVSQVDVMSKDHKIHSHVQAASKFEEYDDEDEYEDYEDYEEEEEEGEYEREDSDVETRGHIGFPAYSLATSVTPSGHVPYFTNPNSSKQAQDSGWTCEACWIHNPFGKVKCLACENPKPDPAPQPTDSAVPEVKAAQRDGNDFNIPSTFQFGFTMKTPQGKDKIPQYPQQPTSTFKDQAAPLGTFKFSEFTFAPTPLNANVSADHRNLSLVSEDSDTNNNTSLTSPQLSPRKGIPPPPRDTPTGEENEVVLFEDRAKLYRFDLEAKEWKERGVGQIKILTERGSHRGKTRIILRRDHVYKLACNHYITPGHTNLKPFPSDTTGTKFSWHALDFAQPDAIEGVEPDSAAGKNELFTVKFKTPEVGAKFREVFEKVQKPSQDLRSEIAPTNGVKKETNLKEVSSSGSSQGSEEEGSVSVIYENKPTVDQMERAKALQLSPYFYTYENSAPNNPHHGCKGCTYTDEEGEEGDEEESEDRPKAAPQQHKLVKVAPDGHLIDEGTGEDILFNERAKLYRFDNQTSEWKERGLGQMLVLMQPSDSKCRLLFRREAIFKIACNHVVDANLKLQPFGKANNTWAWRALDFAEPEHPNGVEEKFAIKFKNGDIAGKFKETVDLCGQRKPPRPLNNSDVPNVETLNLKENAKETTLPATTSIGSNEPKVPEFAPVFGSVKGTCLGPIPDFASLFQKAHKDPIMPSSSPAIAVPPSTPASFNFGPSKLSVSKTTAPPSFSTTLATTPSASSIKFAFSKTTTLATTAPSAIATSKTTPFQFSSPQSSFTFGTAGGGGLAKKEVVSNESPKPPTHYSTPLNSKIPASPASSIDATQPLNESSMGVDKVFGTGHNLSFAALASNATDKDVTTLEKDDKKVEQFYDPTTFSPFGSINPELLKPKPVFGSATPKAIVKPTRLPQSPEVDLQAEAVENDNGDDDENNSNLEMAYKPIVELVDVTTGEENEIALFNERAKLFRFDNDTNEWKERGVGQFKILRDKDETAKKYRLLLRREQIHKIACNHRLTPHLKFNPFPNDPKGTAVSWQTIDFAENEDTANTGKREFFTVKFRNQDILKAFKETIEKCQEDMK